ncbi:hypothetical protein C8Q72DRAFT_952812 [Fomitopsis betulina]|nr:hypothetical protein C8Q72DRAFT_952812 [Fomitopsis betulina]
MLDWYTDFVGETPCMTYQRLRQICNSDYEVPSFQLSSPGDNCGDQLSSCCCNSVAWALSNLCRNCQWDIDSGSPNGLDAPDGAYYLYRFQDSTSGQYCGDEDIENAVCNAGIKLENFLYNLFWDTGAWFYTYTRESAETDQAAYGNNAYHCSSSSQGGGSATTSSTNAAQVSSSSAGDSSLSGTVALTASRSFVVTTLETQTTENGMATIVPYTTTIVFATQTGSSGSTLGTSSPGIATIVGGVVGGLAGLLLLIALGAWYARNRRNRVGVRAFGQDPFGISESSSLEPGGPTMGERGLISSPLTHGNSAGKMPRKRDLMEQNTRRYHAESFLSLDSESGYGDAPRAVSMSRPAPLPMRLHADTQSSSSFGFTGHALPAYRSEWSDDE